MQKITYASNTLPYVDLHLPLEQILKELEKEKAFFKFAKGRLRIEADELAKQVVTAVLQNTSASYLLGRPESARAATLHMTDTQADAFGVKIQELYHLLQKKFEASVHTAQMTPEEAVQSLTTTLLHLQRAAKKSEGAGFATQFSTKKNLQRKRIHVSTNHLPPHSVSPLLRLSQLQITVAGLTQFQQQLGSSLQAYCSMERCVEECANQEEAEDLWQDLQDLLKQQEQSVSTDSEALLKILELETIGQLKKNATLKYLSFLDRQVEQKVITLPASYASLRPDLKTLISRIEKLETFLWHTAPDDGFYAVSYGKFPCNLRDLFARADAFTKLPIIPLVDGTLGEMIDKEAGENMFRFGLKLKMGGAVPSRGKKQQKSLDQELTVLDYYLQLIDPTQDLHQEAIQGNFPQSFVEKLFLVLVSYYFVFWKLDDATFDPLQQVEKDILHVFAYGTLEEQTKQLTYLATTLRKHQHVRQMIGNLQLLFRFILRQKQASFQYHVYDLHLRVRRGILAQRLKDVAKEQSLFQPNILKGKHKQALKYIQVEENNLVSSSTLCKLDAQIRIDDVLFYPDEEAAEAFDLAYVVDDTPVLPVLFAPSSTSASLAYLAYFQKQAIISLPYSNQNGKSAEERVRIQRQWQGHEGFIYRLVFSLLSFLSLSLLVSYLPPAKTPEQRPYIPLLRLHSNKEKNSSPQETFLAELSRLLAHLFSESYRADHQGLYIGDLIQGLATTDPQIIKQKAATTVAPVLSLPTDASYRLRNALSSLYGRLPRICTLPASLSQATGTYVPLQKLAIVVVSGRESDASVGDDPYKLLTLYGEAVTIDRLTSQSVRITSFHTFAANTDTLAAYSSPIVLADLIDELYSLGYKHILYIAHAPHTEHLRIATTSSDEDEKRYFMSKKVLRTLMSKRSDLIIYPVFFDLYYVSQISKPQVNALYIQDTQELKSLMDDPSQRLVTFFHLFNGQFVNDDGSKKYAGVMAYSTFWNFYDDIVANQDIHRGLLYDKDIHPSLKDDILSYLTLFHFTRCEKSVGSKQNPITLKLNPYEDILGNESVGVCAMQAFHPSSVQFNMLAFLTKVRGIVRGMDIAAQKGKHS